MMYPQISLTEERRCQILSNLPGKQNQQTAEWLHITPPEWIDSAKGPHSSLSIAFLCLLDAVNVALAIDYALFQAHAHLYFFREGNPDDTHELKAINYCRFYVDDAALRFYTAGEHMASVIINAMEIKRVDLPNKGKGSLALQVGNYLVNKYPDAGFTNCIRHLIQDRYWLETIGYRNEWVHNQPRIIEHPGPGVNYKRRSRWNQMSTGSWMMAIGGDTWDRPDNTIDELLLSVTKAGFLLEETLTETSNILYKVLEPEISRNLETEELIRVNIFG